jgi:hypothetical protein
VQVIPNNREVGDAGGTPLLRVDEAPPPAINRRIKGAAWQAVANGRLLGLGRRLTG